MSIQNEITRLTKAKKDIAAAIESKGVSVPSNLTIDGYAAKVSEIFIATVFTGATSNADGTSGLVPAPTSSQKNSYLKGDGTWSSADSALSSNSVNTVQNKAVYSAIPWEYSATFTLSGWTDASTDEKAQGYVYKQTVTPTKKISAAPILTADSMFLGFGTCQSTGVLATDMTLSKSRDTINAGFVYTGSGTIIALVEEKPSSDVTMSWWLKT